MQTEVEKLDGKFEGVIIRKNKSVQTYDHSGDTNGFLLEIDSIRDSFIDEPGVQQVYMTVCDVGKKKGLHEHAHKEDNFCCVSGNCEIVLYKDGEFTTIPMGRGDYKTVKIPPGIAHGIKCVGDQPAHIVNCTYPPYDPNKPDQIEVDAGDW